MKKKLTLEEYTEIYYSELNQQMNNFIKYLDLIMDEAMYMYKYMIYMKKSLKKKNIIIN